MEKGKIAAEILRLADRVEELQNGYAFVYRANEHHILESISFKNQLAEAIKVIEFYASSANWQSFDMSDETPIKHDKEDAYSVPGRMARDFLRKANEEQ